MSAFRFQAGRNGRSSVWEGLWIDNWGDGALISRAQCSTSVKPLGSADVSKEHRRVKMGKKCTNRRDLGCENGDMVRSHIWRGLVVTVSGCDAQQRGGLGAVWSELPDKMRIQIFKKGTARIIRSILLLLLFVYLFRKMWEHGSGWQRRS